MKLFNFRMKDFSTYVVLLLSFCCSCVISSCNDDDDNVKSSSAIIGKWECDYGDDEWMTVQFKSNNTFVATEYYYDDYYDDYDYEVWSGVYEYDKDRKMIITYYEDDDESFIFYYKGNYLLDEDGDRWFKVE